MLAALLNGALAFSGGRVTLERDVSPHNPETSSWLNLGSVPADQVLTLSVPLTISTAKYAALESTLFAVSNPTSETYGQHLTHAQLKTLLAVPEEQIARVRSFFMGAGALAATLSPHADSLTIQMPAKAVEGALQTTLAIFSSKEKPSIRIVRAAATYSVPISIAADVRMVGELHQFPRIRDSRLSLLEAEAEAGDEWPKSCGTSCGATFLTPATLQARYNIPVTAATPQPKNTMAVAEFQGQFFKETDLEAFSSACETKVDVQTVVGENKTSAGVEAELDIEYIKAVAPGVPLTVIYDASYSLLNWGQQLSAMASPPLINSVSYGNDEKQQSGVDYMDSVNTVFMKAGTMGLSILFASGDQGVCGREGCGFFKKMFKPDFPGGSPYVTAVGGTDFVTKTEIGPEKAWTASGGGFSDTFGIPSYQTDAVAAYKSKATLPPATMWNNTGRGYPDVSALGGQGNPYCVATGGRFAGVAGTSASCPVVAGVFARLNGLRLAAGKAPMGFLNPFIYQNPSGFQDVTQGKNTGGMQSYGFEAIAGWDPATGMGTPDYDALSKLI